MFPLQDATENPFTCFDYNSFSVLLLKIWYKEKYEYTQLTYNYIHINQNNILERQ
jgi:hypothetical protein